MPWVHCAFGIVSYTNTMRSNRNTLGNRIQLLKHHHNHTPIYLAAASCLSWAPRTELCRKLRPRYHFSGWFIAARGIRDMTVAGSLRCHLTRCGNLSCALMCAFVQRRSASMCVHVQLCAFVNLGVRMRIIGYVQVHHQIQRCELCIIKALCATVHQQRQQTDCNWLKSHSWAR